MYGHVYGHVRPHPIEENLRFSVSNGSGKGTTVVVSHEVLILLQVPGACQLLLQPQYETSNDGWFCHSDPSPFGSFGMECK